MGPRTLTALTILSASDSSPASPVERDEDWRERDDLLLPPMSTEMIDSAEDSAADNSGSSSGDGQARLAAATWVERHGLVGVGGGDSRGGGAAGGKDAKVRMEWRFFPLVVVGFDFGISSGEMGAASSSDVFF
jgi:hypothetical protein